MDLKKRFSSYEVNERIATLTSYLIVALMMLCLSISLVAFMEQLDIHWDLGYLIWVSPLISIEAIFSYQRLTRSQNLITSKILYRFVEWIMIILFLKVVEFLSVGFEPFTNDFWQWQDDFLNSFINTEFVVSLSVAIVIWVLSTWFSEDLEGLSGDAIILEGIKLEANIRDRIDSRQRIVNRVYFIGAAIILLTALSRIDLRRLFGEEVFSFSRLPIVNVILYFLLGVLLFSLTQFSNLRVGWAWDRIPIAPKIALNWIRYSLLIFLVFGMITFMLPTSFALGFLPALRYILAMVIYLLNIILVIILLPFILIVSLLLSLLGSQPIRAPNNIIPAMPRIPVADSVVNLPVTEFVKSLLFWIIFLGLIGFAIYQYINQNRDLFIKIQNIPVVKLLIRLMNWIKSGFISGAGGISEILSKGIERISANRKKGPSVSSWRFTNIRKLNPRDQVLFWYLVLIRRGEEYGFTRKPSQTPYEYADSISTGLSDVSEEIDLITESFMEARYSEHGITEEHAGSVMRYWKKIKRKLGNIRKR